MGGPPSSSTGISLDDALVRHLGQFGFHQRKLFFVVSLLWLSNAMFVLMAVFTNKDPVKAHWWRCVSDTDASCQAVYAMPLPGAAFCDMSSSQWEWTARSMSTISQWDLVCGKAVLGQLVNSAFFLGYLIGAGVFGSMADHHGRKKTLVLALGVATLSTVMSSLSPSFWVFFTSRVLAGVGAAGQAMVTYLIATESVGPAWRGSVGVGTQMFFVLGEFLLVLCAYVLQPWRQLCFCTVVIAACSGLLIIMVPESPRWLLAKGRMAEAEVIIQLIADENHTRPPLEPLATPLPQGPPGEGGHDKGHVSLGSVLRDRHIFRRFVILSYVWCILCLMYYGIGFALGGLQGSLYVTFLIAAAAEIPSNLMAAWLIERIGRHNSLAAGMLLGGVACLVCSFCPPGASQAFFAAVGKFGCAGAFTIASIYTSELFPTLVRSAVLGLENEAARVGGIAAPFVVLLGTQLHSSSLPFLVFGATSVLAGLLIFTLPETRGSTLPESMQDMDQIQSIFTTGAWKQGWSATRSGLFSTHAAGYTNRLPTVPEEGPGSPEGGSPVAHTKPQQHGDGGGGDEGGRVPMLALTQHNSSSGGGDTITTKPELAAVRARAPEEAVLVVGGGVGGGRESESEISRESEMHPETPQSLEQAPLLRSGMQGGRQGA